MLTADDLRIAARLATGRQLNGERKTNARWAVRGTELRDGTEHAGWWAHLPLRRRAGIRLGALAWLALHGYGLAVDFDRTVISLRVEFWITFAVTVWVIVHKTRKWSHHVGYVVPVAAAVAEWLGWSRQVEPASLVTIPLGHRSNPDKAVRINLPSTFREPHRRQQALATMVAGRAGIKSFDWEVQLEGAAPAMLVRAMLVPPDEVMWGEDEEFRRALYSNDDDSRLLLGRGLHGMLIWVDLKQDSPHIAGSIGSGGGKSTLGRFVGAQVVYQGGRCVICDGGKDGESHEDWARDEAMNPTPGVEFYSSIADEHAALVAWEEERKRRAAGNLARTGEVYQRTLIILEERNVTMPALQAYWAQVRDKDDPVKSPAVRAIANLVNAGRSVKMHCLAFAQRFDAAAIGGGAVRGSFQLRIMSRFDEQARRMLIPEIKPHPRSSNHPGRGLICTGGEARDLQLPYMTPLDAIELCCDAKPQTSTRVVVPPRRSEVAEAGPVLRALGPPQDAEAADQEPQDAPAEPVTLADAAEQFGLTLKTLRNGRDRDPDFPEPVARGPRGASLYRASDLEKWAIQREERAFSA